MRKKNSANIFIPIQLYLNFCIIWLLSFVLFLAYQYPSCDMASMLMNIIYKVEAKSVKCKEAALSVSLYVTLATVARHAVRKLVADQLDNVRVAESLSLL